MADMTNRRKIISSPSASACSSSSPPSPTFSRQAGISRPATPGQIFLFTSLSILAFILFVAVLMLLVRNVLKLYADQRSRVMGTRLRVRMLWGAVLVSLIPIVFMSLFSYGLMNRAVERWFSQPVTRCATTAIAWRSISPLQHSQRARRGRLHRLKPARRAAPAPTGHDTARSEKRRGGRSARIAKRSTTFCASMRSPCRTASRSSSVRAAASPHTTCPSRPEPPRRSRPGCRIGPSTKTATATHPPTRNTVSEHTHRRRDPRRRPAYR